MSVSMAPFWCLESRPKWIQVAEAQTEPQRSQRIGLVTGLVGLRFCGFVFDQFYVFLTARRWMAVVSPSQSEAHEARRARRTRGARGTRGAPKPRRAPGFPGSPGARRTRRGGPAGSRGTRRGSRTWEWTGRISWVADGMSTLGPGGDGETKGTKYGFSHDYSWCLESSVFPYHIFDEQALLSW